MTITTRGQTHAFERTSDNKYYNIKENFIAIRQQSANIAGPLSEADAQLQSMPDVSPCKWHLAHTTWFFETFILKIYQHNYRTYDQLYNFLFNSYYNGIGKQYPRHQRGLISRPSLQEIIAYRRYVDEVMLDFIEGCEQTVVLDLIILGLQHEQQHQELMLTDIKHCLFKNPAFPAYRQQVIESHAETPLHWLKFDAQMTTIGCDTEGSFSFDNECPAHSVFIHDFELCARLVTNDEYLAFIDAGAYQNPQYWLSDGWAWLQNQRQWQHPLYWVKRGQEWFEYSLHGLQPLDPQQSVIHLNYYEATAYANWLGLRLPTEFEWEFAVKTLKHTPKLQHSDLHPRPSIRSEDNIKQIFGHCWQWTSSAYNPYPGFQPLTGVAGEYNGKFMSNQLVLRGSSCVTPVAHARISYRNFFYPHQSWQFTGLRLAR